MDPRYPIGIYANSRHFKSEDIVSFIDTLSGFPQTLESLVGSLSEDELKWRYRPDGWTIAQVVHHCADSHMNSFIRFKWTLTEQLPTIKAYDEAKWAALPDANNVDIQPSLLLIKGLHKRWVRLLENLNLQQLDLSFRHPETGKKITLKKNISLYAWHCEHHLAHIRQALEYKGILE